MTVPTAALAAAKTRRKRSGGGGNDEEMGGGDDGGVFGGGDDGFGGNGGENGDGSFDDSLNRWLQDVMLLWGVFCVWSAWTSLGYVTKQKQQPLPIFAALSYSAVKARLPLAAAS